MFLKYLANLSAIFCVIVWGGTFISTKILLTDLTPMQILLYRTVTAWVSLWVINSKIKTFKSYKMELLYILASLCGVSVYFLFENYALRYTYASNASFLVTTSPIISTIFTLVFFKRNDFNVRNFLAMILSLIGVYFLIYSGNASKGVNLIGDFLALFASIVWSLFAIILSELKDNLSPSLRIRKIFGYSIISIITIMAITDNDIYNKKIITYSCIVNILYLGILASAFCYFLWNYSVSKVGISSTMIYMYLVPVVTTIFAFFILHEKITIEMLISSLVIIFGVMLFNKYTYLT